MVKMVKFNFSKLQVLLYERGILLNENGSIKDIDDKKSLVKGKVFDERGKKISKKKVKKEKPKPKFNPEKDWLVINLGMIQSAEYSIFMDIPEINDKISLGFCCDPCDETYDSFVSPLADFLDEKGLDKYIIFYNGTSAYIRSGNNWITASLKGESWELHHHLHNNKVVCNVVTHISKNVFKPSLWHGLDIINGKKLPLYSENDLEFLQTKLIEEHAKYD